MLREASWLERAGRLPEAERAYQRLLARWPDLPDSWYNLARLQRMLRHFDAALASYQQALDRNVSRPEEVHLNRGVIYSDCLRRDDAAARELETALALNPVYVPALANLANLKSDLGKRDEALALYQRILAIDPGAYEALARCADLAIVAGPDDPMIGRLRHALADPRATAPDRAALGFALGRVLDACGAYAAAFDAYAAANRASRACAPAGAVLYDRRQQELLVDRLIAAFPRALPKSGPPTQGVRPIFICGMFRSGSTLTEQVLAGHSQVTAGGEIDFVPELARTTLAPFPERMAQVTSAQLEDLAANYSAGLARLFPGSRNVTDKRPDNFLYVGLIKSLFPDAKIVHTTRDAARHLPVGSFPPSRPRDGIRARPDGHGALLPAVPAPHGALEIAVRRGHPRLRLRHVRARPPTRDRATAGFLRSRLGRRLHGLSPRPQRRQDGERLAGARAALPTLVGRWRHYARQLEPLRAYLGDLLDAPAAPEP